MKNATPKTKRFRGRPTIEASREQAIQKQYAAGLKNLWRPDQDGNAYQTKEAVHAWAVRQVDEFIARGVLVIRDPEVALCLVCNARPQSQIGCYGLTCSEDDCNAAMVRAPRSYLGAERYAKLVAEAEARAVREARN